jgi:hypothetical protein|tara:strand:- start:194 stop:385 length:192 start_codon:yes stop_codon:yes gene_type:complete
MTIRKLNRYKENLTIINGTDVYSYTTKVAEIKGDELHVLGWWSQTTSKHVNYVAQQFNLTKID